mmetsp:Transcript_80170/g.245071  ORF Transcript_80170/g.245071 Transcript_80170/m.245071 type:complete len:203 (+) Transcript_80170:667-1275(+)
MRSFASNWGCPSWSSASSCDLRQTRTQHRPAMQRDSNTKAITEPPTDATSVGSASGMKPKGEARVVPNWRSCTVVVGWSRSSVVVVVFVVNVNVVVLVNVSPSPLKAPMSNVISPVVTVLIRSMVPAAATSSAVKFCLLGSNTSIKSATGAPFGIVTRASTFTDPGDSSMLTKSSDTFAAAATLLLTILLKLASTEGTSANL